MLLRRARTTVNSDNAAVLSFLEMMNTIPSKFVDEAKKQGREDLVGVLTQVPRYPARNFREALQFFKILHYSLWLEGN